MKREHWIFAAVGVALAGVLAAAFLVFFERVEEEITTPPGPAARVNAYLAAERLLAAMGLVRLPPPDHAIVLVTSRRTLGADRVRWLLDWVELGGHLIAAPRRLEDEAEDDGDDEAEDEPEDGGPEAGEDEAPQDEPDPLFAALGLELELTAEGEAETLRLAAGPGAPPCEVSVARSPRLVAAGAEPQFAAGPEGGVVLRLRRGAGWVTVLADAAFLSNSRIGEHEHARFLWSLVNTPVVPAGVWLVYRDRLPGLRQLLFGRAWTVLASGALLLAAWLWHRGARFGPLLAPPPSGRRSLREHLGATAEFLWRRGQTAALVASERQAVLHAVQRQHPTWGELAERERISYLAELSGVSGGVLAQALEGRVGDDPAELTRVIATLEKVRRSL